MMDSGTFAVDTDNDISVSQYSVVIDIDTSRSTIESDDDYECTSEIKPSTSSLFSSSSAISIQSSSSSFSFPLAAQPLTNCNELPLSAFNELVATSFVPLQPTLFGHLFLARGANNEELAVKVSSIKSCLQKLTGPKAGDDPVAEAEIMRRIDVKYCSDFPESANAESRPYIRCIHDFFVVEDSSEDKLTTLTQPSIVNAPVASPDLDPATSSSSELDVAVANIMITDAPISSLSTFSGAHSHVLVSEFVPGCDLFEFLVSHQQLNEDQLRKPLFDLCKFLHFLHTRVGICHLDISLENILRMPSQDSLPSFASDSAPPGSFNLKLCDFGLARQLPPPTQSGHVCGRFPSGTRLASKAAYAAPELWLWQEFHGDRADVFSLAMTVLSVVTGVDVLGCLEHKQNVSDSELYRYYVVEHPELFFRMFQDRGIKGVSVSLAHLLLCMLCPERMAMGSGRFSMEQALAHPFFSSHGLMFSPSSR